MKLWVLLVTGAVSPFLFNSTLPSAVVLILLLFTVFAYWTLPLAFRVFCMFPLMFLITNLTINQRISQRLPLVENKTSQGITGVIGSLPETRADGIRFLFLPDRGMAKGLSKIYVSWYKQRGRAGVPASALPQVRAGERWRLQLNLRSPRGRVNFNGADAERWYFTQGIDALAYVEDGENRLLDDPAWFNLQHWRETVLERLDGRTEEIPAMRILTALAVADRRDLRPHDREVLSATGTGHLLAISGLHIGLAAMFGFYLGRMSLLFLFHGLRQRLAVVMPWLAAWLSAFLYTALSGFGVSTQRALIMLTVATFVVLYRRNIHPFQAWLIAMSLVLLADPVAPLRAGFWFSFIAVGVLMMLFVPRHGVMPVWRRMILAQLGISLVMAPLGMYWFQQASLPGALANIVAIPVVSLLVVPLVLFALLVLCLPGPLVDWSLSIAGHSASGLLMFLDVLAGLQPTGLRSTRNPGLMATILAMLGAALVMMPRGMPGRSAGVLLMLPLFLPAADRQGNMTAQVDFMDVGQGLSVLLTTPGYQLLYDTGPGNGLKGHAGLDMVKGTIQPMIEATGRRPDLIVASHADLDHAGGLGRLQSIYPDSSFLASLPVSRAGIAPCSATGTWVEGKLEFKILHPSDSLPYLGNDSSCVISVNGPGMSLLLSGDISDAVEQRLVDEGLMQHAILSVPHHGSSTSSSQVMVDSVRPRLALVSAAYANRFDFPHAEVMARYTRNNVATLDTARCGGVRINTFATGDMEVSSARANKKAIWRWSAIGNCP